MKKCMYCGKEGTAPNVRGAKSVAVSIGNFRMAANVDIEICDMCAEAMMGAAVGRLLFELEKGGAK